MGTGYLMGGKCNLHSLRRTRLRALGLALGILAAGSNIKAQSPDEPAPAASPTSSAPGPTASAPEESSGVLSQPGADQSVAPAGDVAVESPSPGAEAVSPPATPADEAIPAQSPAEHPTGIASPVGTIGTVSRPLDPGVVIDRFEFAYGLPHPDLPPVEELATLPIRATREAGVLRAPVAGNEETITLGNVPAGSRFDGDVLAGIAQEIVRWYNQRGLSGVWVAYTDLERSANGVVDNRAEGNRSARLVIWASQIAEVRTLARGKRFKPERSINNPKHRRIISRSPLRAPAGEDQPGSLFSRSVLDDYLFGLSLHPGRRVEASIASAGVPGKVVLDYLVNEARSWQVFGQFNNYGSESTGRNRVRFGFQHNQLSNHDDILNFDVVSTPDFKTYGTFLSYRIPLWRPAKVLARVYGSYGDFVAAEGDPTINLRYIGENWLGGLEFSNRISLWRDWQLVSVLGANFNHYGVQQKIGDRDRPLVNASAEFLVPFVGTTLSRNFRWGSVSGGVRLDQATSASDRNLDRSTGVQALGRQSVDSEWTSLRWNAGITAYLEQLFTPTGDTTLAHEVTGRLRGRLLMGGELKRLIPHEQEPLGGALSVRGYPESILSADEFVGGTFEYAWHLPRSLKAGPVGKVFRWPFKWRPRQAGENPDWDLALRAFYDYAYRKVYPAPTIGTPAGSGDQDLTFIERSFAVSGAGVGIAILVKQNFSLRCDYGMALTELRDPDRPEKEQIIVPQGNKEFYLVTSFSW